VRVLTGVQEERAGAVELVVPDRARALVGEEQRVVEVVGYLGGRAGRDAHRVECQLVAALGGNQRAALPDSGDLVPAAHAGHAVSIWSDASDRGREPPMPLIRVELFDYRVNEETSAKLIAGLTDALCAATAEGLRDHTWVIVEGHDPKNWGLGGKPWPVGEMPPRPAWGLPSRGARPGGHPQRRDRRARGPRQDDARRRDALAVRLVPREPGRSPARRA